MFSAFVHPGHGSLSRKTRRTTTPESGVSRGELTDNSNGRRKGRGGVGRWNDSLTPLFVLASQALAGPHFYTWGDHGGILMAIAQGGATAHLK